MPNAPMPNATMPTVRSHKDFWRTPTQNKDPVLLPGQTPRPLATLFAIRSSNSDPSLPQTSHAALSSSRSLGKESDRLIHVLVGRSVLFLIAARFYF